MADSAKIASSVRDAREMISRGDLDNAEAALSPIVESSDPPAEAVLQLARVRAAQAQRLQGDVRFLTQIRKKNQEAKELADRAVRIDPSYAAAAAQLTGPAAAPNKSSAPSLTTTQIVIIVIVALIVLAAIGSGH